MKIYRFDAETGSEQGWMDWPDADATVYLAQPGFTVITPPSCPAGQAHRMQDGEWACAVDLRGQLWHDPVARVQDVIHEVGFVPPAGWVYGPLPPVAPTASQQLDRVRLVARARIKTERDARIRAPKVTPHGTFDATDKAQNDLGKVIDLVRAAAARGMPAEGRFTLSNNVRLTFTLTELEDVALAIGAQVQALFDAADLLFQQIGAATTLEEAEGVIWPPE